MTLFRTLTLTVLALAAGVALTLGTWLTGCRTVEETQLPPANYQPPAAAELSPAEAIVADLEAALEKVSSWKDYTCQFIKRERVGGSLLAEETIRLKVRHQPFSAYLYFQEPEGVRGQEALYVEGANDGHLIAHGAGLQKSLIGTLELEPTSQMAMMSNRHPITSIGLKNLLQKMRSYKFEESKDLTFRRAEVTIQERQAVLWEFSLDRPIDGMDFAIGRIYLDAERGIPIRYECFGWPAAEGKEPPLLEFYDYREITPDVGLTDEDFSKENPAYDF